MAEIKMIKLKPKTHTRLLDYATKGETFDDAICRLLDNATDNKFKVEDAPGMVEQINWDRDHPESMAKLPVDDDFRNALIKDKSARATAIIIELRYTKDPEYHARLRRYYMGDEIYALTLAETMELNGHIKYNQKWYDLLERYNREHPTS